MDVKGKQQIEVNETENDRTGTVRNKPANVTRKYLNCNITVRTTKP